MGGGGSEFVIGFEGQKWAIGESVQTIGTGHRTIRDTSRIETPFYRTLFASMLARAVPCAPGTSVEVAPVLSLPPGMYYEKERLKEALAGIYDVDAPVQGSLREPGPRRSLYHVPLVGIQRHPRRHGHGMPAGAGRERARRQGRHAAQADGRRGRRGHAHDRLRHAQQPEKSSAKRPARCRGR
ncbi:MAG: hypothetical protein U0521_28615 [Anaerolineae bacterium]